MTRQEQLKRAIQLLAPPKSKIASLRDELNEALDTMELAARSGDGKDLTSKKTKQALDVTIAALKKARVACRALPGIIQQISFRDLDFDKHIRDAQKWRNRSSSKGGLSSHTQRQAVKAAYSFCPKPVVTTRSGKWHKLSAIFFGDASADLYRHMLEFRKLRAKRG